METFFYTHIPKTAGTSVRMSTFEQRFSDQDTRQFRGYWDLLADQKAFRLLKGHFAYGAHLMCPGHKPAYFVMLREPVSRLLSYYYFYRQSTAYENDVYKAATTKSFLEFCATPRYQNVQARFVAGAWWQQIGRSLGLNNTLGCLMLMQAERNLTDRYKVFGIKEEFQRSVALFASVLNVEPSIPDKRHKNTDGRLRRRDLSAETIEEIEAFNAVDVAFYEYALRHFDRQRQTQTRQGFS